MSRKISLIPALLAVSFGTSNLLAFGGGALLRAGGRAVRSGLTNAGERSASLLRAGSPELRSARRAVGERRRLEGVAERRRSEVAELDARREAALARSRDADAAVVNARQDATRAIQDARTIRTERLATPAGPGVVSRGLTTVRGAGERVGTATRATLRNLRDATGRTEMALIGTGVLGIGTAAYFSRVDGEEEIPVHPAPAPADRDDGDSDAANNALTPVAPAEGSEFEPGESAIDGFSQLGLSDEERAILAGEVPDGSTRTPTHTIAQGDTLWDIAKNACGEGVQWQEIYRANQGRPGVGNNPNSIPIGTELILPCGEAVALTPADVADLRTALQREVELDAQAQASYRRARVAYDRFLAEAEVLKAAVAAENEAKRALDEVAERCQSEGGCRVQQAALAQARADREAAQARIEAQEAETRELWGAYTKTRDALVEARNARGKASNDLGVMAPAGQIADTEAFQRDISALQSALETLREQEVRDLRVAREARDRAAAARQRWSEFSTVLRSCQAQGGSCDVRARRAEMARDLFATAQAQAEETLTKLSDTRAQISLATDKLKAYQTVIDLLGTEEPSAD